MSYGEKEFKPDFRALFILLLFGVVFAGIATGVTGILQVVFFLAGGIFLLTGVGWFVMLNIELDHARKMAEQSAECQNLLALSRFSESISAFPPAAHLAALHQVAPAIEFDKVEIPPEGIQLPPSEGWNIQKTLPGGLARPDQYRILANEYFDDGKRLSVRYWTETNADGRPPVFGRKQFEKILDELVKAGFASKNASGEVVLNADGETWLRRYYLPTVDGFTPVWPRTQAQNTPHTDTQEGNEL